MELETEARDCLYVNWAIPLAAAPALPGPLRYEVHGRGDEETVFLSVLCFRLTGLHLPAIPWGRVSYPQATLRFYVLDGDDIPAVYFLRTLVPWWVLPAARLFGRQPVRPARLHFPRPSQDRHAECWRWRLWEGTGLSLTATLASPEVGPGPSIGSFRDTVNRFRQRRRGYVKRPGGVRLVRAERPDATVWPMRVEVERTAWLENAIGAVATIVWQRPHSAWLSPQIPFRFAVGPAVDRTRARSRMPATEGA